LYAIVEYLRRWKQLAFQAVWEIALDLLTTQALKYTFTLREEPDGFDRVDIDLPQVRVGNIRCWLGDDTATIFSIQIFPEYQRNGYGRDAVNMLKNRYTVLIADRVRFTARSFWEKMGFKPRDDGNWEFRGVRKTQFTK
jgi:ribosomal protein S18 acetylase RimI-like enzyme